MIHEVKSADFVQSASPSMRIVEGVMLEVAHTDVPVLLLAEAGAGKKAIARRIHDASHRACRPLHRLACEALGPEDSSWKNAMQSGGTVFLEELTALRPQSQRWLLQTLMGTVSNGRAAALARLICGSACDLESEVKAGRFSEDLYYRVSGMCLRLPPLRQRREDIPILVEHFLKKYGRDFQRPVAALSPQTQRLFQEYSWPGNIGELENATKAIVALGDENVAMDGLRAILSRPDHGGNGVRVSLKQVARAASREAEKEIILRALTRTRWNRRRAAQELQISYKALLYKLKQMGHSGYEAS